MTCLPNPFPARPRSESSIGVAARLTIVKRRLTMKHPLILALVATALGSTASILVAATSLTGGAAQAVPTLEPFAAESAVLAVEREAKEAGWLRLVSDDDDDEADDECDDDDEDDGDDDGDDGEGDEEDDGESDGEDQPCGTVQSPSATGAATPPNNGLFSTGKAPQVKSN